MSPPLVISPFAGLLSGRAATINWMAMDELHRPGAVPRAEHYVFDGKYVTGAGVSASIDMALAWRTG